MVEASEYLKKLVVEDGAEHGFEINKNAFDFLIKATTLIANGLITSCSVKLPENVDVKIDSDASGNITVKRDFKLSDTCKVVK